MPVTVHDDPSDLFVVMTIDDAPVVDEWRAGVMRVFESPIYHARGTLLIDRRRAGTLRPTAIHEMLAFIEEQRSRLSHRYCAIVTGSDVGFGLARMAQALVDGIVPYGVLRTFRDYDEAAAWLKSITPSP